MQGRFTHHTTLIFTHCTTYINIKALADMAVQYQEDCSSWNARTESVSQLDAAAEVCNTQAMLFKRLYMVEANIEHP